MGSKNFNESHGGQELVCACVWGGGGDDIDTVSCLLTFFDCHICGCNKKRAWHFVGVYISGIIYVRAPSQMTSH